MIAFALIGCGRIGQRHAHHISEQGVLTAVCDIDERKARDLGKRFDIPYYTSHADLIARERSAQVVAVCTPNGLHARHSIDALHGGFHVLCEKPMAINVDDCKKMIEASESVDRKLFVVKQNRFNPPVRALKKLLDEGRLGKIYSVQVNCFWNRDREYYENSWRGSPDLDGGTLYTQFSHFIDLLYWLIGDVREAFALTANYHHQGCIAFEDTGCVLLHFTNGAIGTLHYTVNSFSKNMEGSITIFGERGTVKVGGQYLNELEYQSIEGYAICDLPKGNPANHYGSYQGSMSNHNEVYKEVIRALCQGGHTTTGYDGLKTVEIIGKIYEAAAKQRNSV